MPTLLARFDDTLDRKNSLKKSLSNASRVQALRRTSTIANLVSNDDNDQYTEGVDMSKINMDNT